MTKVPYSFQEKAIELGLKKNMFLGDECGLGKKLMCLEVARRIQSSLHLPTLVVTIKQDTLQWVKEIETQDSSIQTTIGTVDPLIVQDCSDWWLILHYEALVRHQRALGKINFGTIILDEGHYIKSPHAQRSKATKHLKAFRKIVATGTPINKSPVDLWSPLDFLYPVQFRGKLGAFREEHERSFIDAAGYTRILPGAKNPRALGALLAPFYIARTKDEVAPELPPNIIKTHYLELSGSQASLYRRIATSQDIEVDLGEMNALGPKSNESLFIPSKMVQILREQQCAVDPGLLGSSASSVKLEWLRNWMDSNSEEPVIIFTNYRRVAQAVAAAFDTHLVMGGVKLPEDWSTKRAVTATIGAGSAALDLGFLRTAIFLDTHWSSLKMQQALNRIHRISNTRPVETIYLTAANTVDELFLEAFQNNWDQYTLIRNHAQRFSHALNTHK